jgi:hypothetical protein
MTTDTLPPTRLFVLWSWAWWASLLAAVPVQGVVIGGVMYGSVGTMRSVGRPIPPTPGTPPVPVSPRVAAGDASAGYLLWLPVTQVVLAGVVVTLPNRPVKTALRRYHLWVWLPLASVALAWVLCAAGRDGIYSESF